MSAAILPQPAAARPDDRFNIQIAVAIVLIAWLLLVVSLGAAGAFIGTPRTPPIPLAVAIAAPLLLFFGWLRLSRVFREFIYALDLRLVVAMQGWRWAGLGFLSLYAHKVLPAVFALPAGLGDMAVGLTAPVDCSGPGTSTPVRHESRLPSLECSWHLGPRHRHWHRNRQCHFGDRRTRGDQHRPDGDTAVAAHPGIPGPVFPDAACNGPDAEAAALKDAIEGLPAQI